MEMFSPACVPSCARSPSSPRRRCRKAAAPRTARYSVPVVGLQGYQRRFIDSRRQQCRLSFAVCRAHKTRILFFAVSASQQPVGVAVMPHFTRYVASSSTPASAQVAAAQCAVKIGAAACCAARRAMLCHARLIRVDI